METIQTALQKMGSNFIVASFVPALGFVVSNIIVFFPIMPPSVMKYMEKIGENFLQVTVVILLFTILLGFTLFTLSTYIYKMFEGYTFVFSSSTILGKAGLRRQMRRVKVIERRRIERALQTLEDRIYPISEKSEDERTLSDILRLAKYQQKIEYLEGQKYTTIANYHANFPKLELILPTRFGNILRAAETYPGERYGIDAVELWPRLAHSIPPEGMALIDQANNECLFLLNSSLLACVLSIQSLIAAIYQYVLFNLAPNHSHLLFFIPIFHSRVNEYQQLAGIYLVISIILVLIAWFFYEASLLNVGQFGLMIKSSYDIYRFSLIEALHLPPPSTLGKEIDLWQKISAFLASGFEIDHNVDFKYLHNKK